MNVALRTRELCWIFYLGLVSTLAFELCLHYKKHNKNEKKEGFKNSVPDPYFWLTDPDPDPALFVSDLQDAPKKCYVSFYADSFLKKHLHHSSKIKSHKKPKNSRNQDFTSVVCLLMQGSVQINYGSGCRRPNNLRILRMRFRLRNSLFKKIKNVKNEKELCLDEDNEVEVVPHVVLVANMLLKGHVFVVESLQNKYNLFVPF